MQKINKYDPLPVESSRVCVNTVGAFALGARVGWPVTNCPDGSRGRCQQDTTQATPPGQGGRWQGAPASFWMGFRCDSGRKGQCVAPFHSTHHPAASQTVPLDSGGRIQRCPPAPQQLFDLCPVALTPKTLSPISKAGVTPACTQMGLLGAGRGSSLGGARAATPPEPPLEAPRMTACTVVRSPPQPSAGHCGIYTRECGYRGRTWTWSENSA